MVSKTVWIIVAGVIAVAALGIGLGVGLSGDSDGIDVTTISAVTDPVPTNKKFTLQDYIDKTYSAKSVSPNFVHEHQLDYRSDLSENNYHDLYWKQNSETSDVELWSFAETPNKMVENYAEFKENSSYVDEEGNPQKPFDWRMSPDGKWIFYGFNFQKLWRTVSYNASYELYSVESQEYVNSMFDDPKFATDEYCIEGKNSVQYLTWGSPYNDNIAGAFVCGFNVFYFTNPTDLNSVVKVTDDGLDNNIYNGIPEWANEEEVIGGNNVIYFSRQGSKMFFVKYITQTFYEGNDDHIYKYSWYGTDQYPKTLEISYAKAGTEPSANFAYVFDTETEQTYDLYMSLEPNALTFGEEPSLLEKPNKSIFFRMDWNMYSENSLVAIWTNRIQTESKAIFFDFNSDSQKWSKYNSKNAAMFKEDNGWVGSFGPAYPFNDGKDTKNYFTVRTLKVSELSIKNLKANRDNTQGNEDSIPEGFWTVARVDADSDETVYLSDHSAVDANKGYTDTELWHWDATNDILFYKAAYPEPRHRQLHMVVGASKATGPIAPVSATQALLEKHPDRCGWINVHAGKYDHSSGANDDMWVTFNCAGGVGLPATFRKKLSAMQDTSYESFELIEANSELAENLDEVDFPVKAYGSFQSSTYAAKEFNYQIFKPKNFDESKKYKLVIEVYAGPEFQKVTDTYSPDFCQSMVSEYDIICASVDGRGSAFEGDRFMQQIYKKLGQYEPIDQTEFAKWMATHDWIDADNIAIWGWSYGGYTTTHTLAYNNNNDDSWHFKCGVAVAPLASWRYYDIVYAERYLQTPAMNDDGYTKAEVWYHAENNNYDGFRNSWYTLISGTADDNVHFMSPAHIEKKLVSNDVDFDNFFYADEDHSIRSSPVVNYHVYQNIRRHLLNKRCLNVL